MINIFDVNPKQAIYTRVFDILDTFNHWDVLSNEYTIEQLRQDIQNRPLDIIEALTNIIEEAL